MRPGEGGWGGQEEGGGRQRGNPADHLQLPEKEKKDHLSKTNQEAEQTVLRTSPTLIWPRPRRQP